MKLALQTQQLTVSYGGTNALWNANACVPENSMTGIVGPNGAGKSTLLKAMLGTVPLMSGRVELAANLRNDATSIAYVPQRNTVDWDFPTTVFDLVMMGTYGRLKWFQRPGSKERADTLEALKLVQMEDFADRQIGELSGGQQQRAFLARAFVQKASVYLMDEPFAGVDAKSESLLIEILRRLRDEGNTIALVHHDLTTVRSYFDHVVLLNQRVIGCGSTDAVFTDENIQHAYGVSGKALLERV